MYEDVLRQLKRKERQQQNANRSTLVRHMMASAAFVVVSLMILTLFPLKQVGIASGPSDNRRLTYQIRLTDLNGIPVADGTKNIKISFYDAATAGTTLHTDCGTTGTPVARKVIFTSGIGTVVIGDTAASGTTNCADASAPNAIPTTLFNASEIFLGITVEADAEMTPRKRITASPQALNADRLDDLDTSNAALSSAYVPVTTSTGTLLLTRLGVNSTPNTATHVQVSGVTRLIGPANTVLTGSIDPTASTAVVGVGTLFTTELAVGDMITVSGVTRIVSEITDNTNLTVGEAFTDVANDASVDRLPAVFSGVDNAGVTRVSLANTGALLTGRLNTAFYAPGTINSGIIASRTSDTAGFLSATFLGPTLYPVLANDASVYPFTGGCSNMQLAGPGQLFRADGSTGTIGGIGDSGRISAGCNPAFGNFGLDIGISQSNTFQPMANISNFGMLSLRVPMTDNDVWRIQLDSDRAGGATAQPKIAFGPGTDAALDVSIARTASGVLSIRNAANSADAAFTASTGTFSGAIAANGDSITSDADLTITPAGGDLILADGTVFNVGGSGSDVAYNVIGDSTAGASGSMTSDDDLYIEGNLEVDGSISGTIDPGFTTGSVIFQGSGLAQDNANFFWDDAANRLSLGEHTVSQSATRLQLDDATNSAAALELFTIRRSRADATAPVADFGSDIGFRLENATDGGDVLAARIRGAWSTAPASQQTGYLSFAVTSDPSGGSPVLTEAMRVVAVTSATSSQNPVRVGINATTPRGAFDVVGNSTSSSTNTMFVSNDSNESHGNILFTTNGNGANRVAIGNSNSNASQNRALQNHPYVWFNSANDLMISTSATAPTANETTTNVADFTSFGLETVNTAVLGTSNTLSTPLGGFGHYENGLTFSEQFDNAAWTITGGSVTGIDSATAAPDGSTTAELVNSSSTLNVVQTATAYTASGNTFTGSVWMRISGTISQTITLRIDCGATTGTGSDKLVNGGTWQRFYVTQTCGAVAGNPSLVIRGPAITGFDILLWGAQLEQQSSPGVYLKTTSTAVTTANSGLLANVGNITSTTAAQVTAPTLTTGTGLLVSTPNATLTTNGELLDLNMGAATAGNGIAITTTGIYTGTGLITATANSATTGTGVALSMTGLTTGSGIAITGGSALQASGELLNVDMDAATVGRGVNITTTGVYTGTGIVGITANSLTTGIGVALSMSGQTSGTGILITGGGANMLAGGVLVSANMGAATVGGGLTTQTSGVYTGSGLLQVSAASATTGTGAIISMSGLTSGTGLNIVGGSSMIANGELINANMGAATAGNGVVVTTTGVYTGTGLITATANSATSGLGLAISMTGITTGAGIRVTGGSSMTSSGELLDLNMGAATVGVGMRILNSGVYTGTGIISATADSATSGIGINLSMAALTSGTGIRVTGGGSMTSTGRLMIADLDTATDGIGVIAQTTGNYTGSGLMQIIADSATTGTGLLISMDSLTTGASIRFDGVGTAMTTGGELIDANMGAATAGNGVAITTSGSYTGTGLAILSGVITTGTGLSVIDTGTTLAAGGELVLLDSETTEADDVIFRVISDVTTGENQVMSIDANGEVNSDQAFNAGGGDYAEYFEQSEMLEKGDVVALGTDGKVRKATATDTAVLGVVSTNPGFVGNNIPGADGTLENNPAYALVGLTGQVPTFVSVENGTISPGDPITVSETAGVGMKATGAGQLIGYALTATTVDAKIMVYVDAGWFNGTGAGNTQTSGLNISELNEDLSLNGYSLLRVASIMSESGHWSIAADGTVFAKKIDAENVTAEHFSVKKTDESATVGKGVIMPGTNIVTIDNPAVHATSEIFISFRSNPRGAWWIQEVIEGSFTLAVTESSPEEVNFSYWILAVEDATTPVVVQETPVLVIVPPENNTSEEVVEDVPVTEESNEVVEDSPTEEENDEVVSEDVVIEQAVVEEIVTPEETQPEEVVTPTEEVLSEETDTEIPEPSEETQNESIPAE